MFHHCAGVVPAVVRKGSSTQFEEKDRFPMDAKKKGSLAIAADPLTPAELIQVNLYLETRVRKPQRTKGFDALADYHQNKTRLLTLPFHKQPS